MGRIDVQRLNVPADFAAIFEQQFEPKPEVQRSAAAGAETPAPPPAAASIDSCSKCNSRLSAVESKMGRCLTCGTTFNESRVTVGL